MADPEIFIVSRLNDCFGLDLTLVDFDEKAPGELLQLLLDVLAELDPRLRGDVRDRGAEAGAAGAADLLRLLKYPPLRERDDGARRAWAAAPAAALSARFRNLARRSAARSSRSSSISASDRRCGGGAYWPGCTCWTHSRADFRAAGCVGARRLLRRAGLF